MRTLIYTLLTIISFTSFSYAQDKTNTVLTKAKEEISKGKESGVFTFVMPSTLSKEEINKNANYYTHYFTVEYNIETFEVKINMIDTDDKSKHIVVRFLTACGIQYVQVEGMNMSTEEFFNSYMR